MANYGIRIDLLKLKGACVRDLQGKAATKRCLIIPVDDCDGLFLGKKGCYLSLTAVEMREPRYNDTHCIKVDLPREKRDAMSEEERRAVPILGGMHAFGQQQTVAGEAAAQPNGTAVQAASAAVEEAAADDLPF